MRGHLACGLQGVLQRLRCSHPLFAPVTPSPLHPAPPGTSVIRQLPRPLASLGSLRKGPELRSRLVTQLYPLIKKSANHLRRQVLADIGPPPRGTPCRPPPYILWPLTWGGARLRPWLRPLSQQCRQTASTDPPSACPWDLPRQTCAQGVRAARAWVWGQLCQGCVNSESEPGGGRSQDAFFPNSKP